MKLTGYILAGGKSSRMGTDKGLLLLKNKPFVSHIYEALSNVCNNIFIVTSNKEYEKLGFNIFEDFIPNKGPVGGIYTALKSTSTDLNFIISVDTPFISKELLFWIINNHNAEAKITLIGNGQSEIPLIAIYDRSLESVFKDALDQDKLQLIKLIHTVKIKVIEIPDNFKNQIQNINTKEEYQNCLP